MFRKIFICAVTFAALLICGCGEEKVIGSPDKAILAYAQIAMTGNSDDLSAAGFVEDDKKEICYVMANRFVESMDGIAPLSNDSAQQLTKIYFDKLQGKINFTTTLKKDDPERPVVEITTTPIDQSNSARTAASNDDFIALIGMVGKLKADGADDKQLKENPDVQKLAVTAIEKYINEISFQSEKTFDVTCQKVKGHGGNNHWAPADTEAFLNFLTGQN